MYNVAARATAALPSLGPSSPHNRPSIEAEQSNAKQEQREASRRTDRSRPTDTDLVAPSRRQPVQQEPRLDAVRGLVVREGRGQARPQHRELRGQAGRTQEIYTRISIPRDEHGRRPQEDGLFDVARDGMHQEQ